jgi:hypothetical protein
MFNFIITTWLGLASVFCRIEELPNPPDTTIDTQQIACSITLTNNGQITQNFVLIGNLYTITSFDATVSRKEVY